VSTPPLLLRELGLVDYHSTLTAMRQLTDSRDADAPDELWLLQHPPVFTQGQAGKAEHLLAPGDIPVIQVDRGGQVTYHGPGQWVLYLMVDLRRQQLSVRDLVNLIERSVVQLLQEYAISAASKPDAPGVYVAGEKVASLGLRIRRGCSYHGLALNVDMDLEPFGRINPCGYEGLHVTSMAKLLPDAHLKLDLIGRRLLAIVAEELRAQPTPAARSSRNPRL
jgi:lipoyl(octanoyl) transferase